MPRSAKKPRGQTPAAVTPYKTSQPVAAPTGLPYGENKALTDSQRAVPLPAASAPPAPSPVEAAQNAASAHAGQPVGLVGPTTRPDEPVTAGLTSGPGPGPEALGQSAGGAFPQDPASFLRSVYAIAPNPDLADLIHYFQSY